MSVPSRPDASHDAEIPSATAPSQDAGSTGNDRDTEPSNQDAQSADAAALGDVAPVEVARIVRAGTNFGRTTVVVYSDASAVRTKEDRLMIEHPRDGMAGPLVEVLPPGTPEVVKLLEDLASVDNVAAIGGNDAYCTGKSISFSTRTHLTAGGEISRNLECDDDATASDPVLTADCLALAK